MSDGPRSGVPGGIWGEASIRRSQGIVGRAVECRDGDVERVSSSLTRETRVETTRLCDCSLSNSPDGGQFNVPNIIRGSRPYSLCFLSSH